MSTNGSSIPIEAMKDLDLGDVSPLHGAKDSLINPLDRCRRVLAELLSSILAACTVDDAYKCLQYPSDTSNGDFTLTVPKLCPGCKPHEVSTELINKVSDLCHALVPMYAYMQF